MPWQREVADVACEFDPATGVPYYREVILVVMRQQGKTTTELAAATDRFVSWDRPQRITYSAQTGGDSRKKLIEDWAPALQGSPLAPLVSQVVRANGHESIRWANGSFVETMASLEASGHGFTRDFGLIDEAWKDQDERREQALRPAMLTIPDAQLWVVSTAGNDASVYLRRKVDAGRDAAVADRGAGICYFEYSVPPDEDPFDLEVMLRYMPALCPTPGPCRCSKDWRHTVTQETLVAEMAGMEPDEARRAFGNQWLSGGGEQVIPALTWDRVQDPTASPSGLIRVGIEVREDRSAGALTLAGSGAIELAETAPGTGWMVERAKMLHSLWGAELVIDGGGPAVPIADDLEAEGVPVTRMTSAQVVAACAHIYDDIADAKVKFRPSQQMDDAVAGLARKPVGDRFVWSRRSSTADITPFFAATLAHATAGSGPIEIEGPLGA